MDLKLFAQALLGQNVDQELAGANPYKPFESIADAMSQRVIQGAAKGEDSTKNLLLGGLLSGIGGGLFSNLSEDYADTQRGRLLSAAQDIYSGKDVERPTGIPSSVFNQLKTNSALGRLSQLEADKEAEKGLKNLVAQETIKQSLANPYAANKVQNVANSLLGLGGAQPAQTGLPVSTGATNPAIKSRDYYMEAAGGDEGYAKELMQMDRERAAKRDSLIKEFVDRPEVKVFSEMAPDVEYLRSIKDTPGALSDIPFIYKFMKIIDPGAVVRESDAGMVIDSKSIDRSLLSKLEKWLSGKQTLELKDRNELIDLAQSSANSRKSLIEGMKVGYQQRAKELGFDNFDVTIPGTSIADLVRDEAIAQGLDPDLLERLARQESSLNPAARSPKGAQGIMQLMPGTAKDLGVDPTDVRQNIKGGVTYFNQMLKKFGNVEDALAAYNAGPGALEEIKAGRQPMPDETTKYVAKILGKKLAPAASGDIELASLIEQAKKAGASNAEIRESVIKRLGLDG